MGERTGRWIRRGVALLGAAVVSGVVGAGSAAAHVRVSGVDAVAGGYGLLSFRVPTESATASTTGLRISFPRDTPFTSVSTQPKAGWSARVTTRALPRPIKDEHGATISRYVATVDFRATASAAIRPGQFDLFTVSAGPLPRTDSVSFAARQTYSDGHTVDWDQRSADGATEPEHPAPTLTISPADSAAAAAVHSTSPTAAGPSRSGGRTWPGLAGLVLGALALVVATAAWLLARGRPVRSAAG